MGGKRWTPENDTELRRLVAEGVPHRDIGALIGRSLDSVRSRATDLNAIMPADLARRNNLAANLRANRDPRNNELRRARISAAFTAERRAEQAERARRVNAKRVYGPVRPEIRHRMAKGLLEHNERKVAWCPQDRRDEYKRLVHSMGAAEAKRIILADIEAKKVELTPFERQMEALRNGARLIAKPVFRGKEYDFTLGGGSPL